MDPLRSRCSTLRRKVGMGRGSRRSAGRVWARGEERSDELRTEPTRMRPLPTHKTHLFKVPGQPHNADEGEERAEKVRKEERVAPKHRCGEGVLHEVAVRVLLQGVGQPPAHEGRYQEAGTPHPEHQAHCVLLPLPVAPRRLRYDGLEHCDRRKSDSENDEKEIATATATSEVWR